jgi:hypothetical protein
MLCTASAAVLHTTGREFLEKMDRFSIKTFILEKEKS